ncbi:MAG: T9SS type A sorting domain-containing protein [Candidatus Cloacimonetes bacterium]|nr:T9SS type A sorting domain-containing protein [Candidatus Cloacimonadota bacterium]
MRKKLIILLSAFCILMNASLFGVNNSQEAVKHFQVLESTATHTTLEFNLPDFEILTEEINNIPFKRLAIQSDGLTPEEGLPELPIYSTLVAIPYHGSASLEIVNKQTYQIDNFVPAPVQEDVAENDRTFAFNADFYNSNSSYPYETESISEPKIIRDFRVVGMTFCPFSYNPATRSLEVTESVTYRINYSNTPSLNEMEAPIAYSPSFEPLYQALITNYEEVIDRTIPMDNKRLLIIYGANDDQDYQDKLAEFIKWKKQKGYKVQAISTADCGSTTAEVKAQIQLVYNNYFIRPEYVLLIGDVTGDMPIECWMPNDKASDYPYTQLAGNDLLGDVFIGRIPAENVTHFQTMVNKVFTYERDPLVQPDEWYNHMLLVGQSYSLEQSLIYLNLFMKYAALNINPNYTFTEYYDDPQEDLMQTAFNQGVSFFVYRGRVWMSGWNPLPAETEFTNGIMMPHCILVNSNTGRYDGSSVTDSFVRYGTPTQPKGAITAIGMTQVTSHHYMQNMISGQIIDSIFNWGLRNMSAPLLAAKLVNDIVYSDSESFYVNYFNDGCNLMGDPTVEVFIGTPQPIIVEYPESVYPGQSCYPVHVEDNDGSSLEGAVVTLVNDANMQLITETDAYGNALIELPDDLVDNTSFTLTVSKHDHVPVYEEIQVINSDGINITSVSFLDAMGGDNDGVPDAGETISFNLTLANLGNTNITNPTITMSTDDPYLTILQNSALFNTIPAGSSTTATSVFQIHIAGNTPPDYHGVVNLEVSGQDYSAYLHINVQNGNIEITNITLDDDNGILEAWETTSFILSLTNSGNHAISELNVELSCESDIIILRDNHAFYGFMDCGEEVNNSGDLLTISARDQQLPGFDIEITAHFYDEAGFSQFETFRIPTGTPDLTSPTGPDNFGHYIYHSSDTAYPNAPVYEWIGIAPDEGGNGTHFSGIIDDGLDHDLGDDVGSITIDNTALPFTFTFYGRDYDEVYVCSNGFLTFVPTELGNFQNYPIPGPMCPDPLIAPFWDDMFFQDGSNGGIFYWYDDINHYFVIEWYNATNGYLTDGYTPEQFEVILYDPIYYPTSTGDGMIKFQYHTFNDIDDGISISNPLCAGQYSSIGISDHTGTDGIQYLFDQDYAPTAQALADGTAILISGEPISELAYVLSIDDVLFCDYEIGNGNSLPDSGEEFFLCANISNQSSFNQENVEIEFSCTDDNVVIGDFNSNISLIPAYSTIQAWVPVTIPAGVPNGIAYNFPVAMQASGYEEFVYNVTLVTGYDAGISTSIGIVNGIVSVDVGTPDLSQALINDGLFLYAGVSSEGVYKFFLELEREYNLVSYLAHYAPGIMNNIVLTTANPVLNDYDFLLNLLAEPTGLFGFLNGTVLNLQWSEPETDYPVLGYNLYRSLNEGSFELIASPVQVLYQDTITEDGLYTYFTEAVYEEGISYPSANFAINVTTANEEGEIPFITQLNGSYPNPFNPITNISYSLAEQGKVKISIYNIRGQVVRTLVNEVQPSGNHTIQWNGKDNNNIDCATGLYMYRFQANGVDTIRKALMLK